MWSKFNARPSRLDGHYFASELERLTYLELKKFCSEYDFFLKLQDRRIIKPSTRNFPARFWKCDFGIYLNEGDDEPILLIESKSHEKSLVAQFCETLKYLDFFSPEDFKKLLIVVDHNIRVKDLEKLRKRFQRPVFPLIKNGDGNQLHDYLLDILEIKKK